MKKLLFLMFALVAIVGCRNEDGPSDVWEREIKAIGSTELSAIDVLASADAWATELIYKFNQADGKGASLLYYDSSEGSDELKRSAMYNLVEDKRYDIIYLREHRQNTADGVLYYNNYQIFKELETNKKYEITCLSAPNREMTVVAYDENRIILEFYNPNAKDYPYTRELLVRVNGAKGLEQYEEYTNLYDSDGTPFKVYKWNNIDGSYNPELIKLLKEYPCWELYFAREAEVRDECVFTSTSYNYSCFEVGAKIPLVYIFSDDKIEYYSKGTLPGTTELYSYSELDRYYWDNMMIFEYVDGVIALTFTRDIVIHYPGRKINVYFLRPSTQEKLDEIVQGYNDYISQTNQ